jgi:hypothetical protein
MDGWMNGWMAFSQPFRPFSFANWFEARGAKGNVAMKLGSLQGNKH